jgi:glycosyltransferase involved in cell wall biosynthesis
MIMRILYISDRGKGGIKNHVKGLLECLKGVKGVETYCIGEDEPFAGKSGHDFAEWKQIRRVIKTFKPDVIHLHTLPLLMCLYIKLFIRVPLFVSLHTPGDRRPPRKDRILHWLVKGAHYLPVSSATWEGFRKWFNGVKGEVFFNPIIINNVMRHRNITIGIKGEVPVIGAVGRNADQKDWPSFHNVADKVCATYPKIEVWNLGEEGFCKNANERIKDMDLFVMTSKHEELPTTVLECFVSKTAICGFIPRGGMSDILSFSNGALKSVFIEERDCDKLAEIVKRLIEDEDLRRRVVDDGWQIVNNHFDAFKNCRGKLLDIYRSGIF